MMTVKQGMEMKLENTQTMKWESDVPFYQQHHLWHGGEVCSIKAGNFTFVIEAVGDVRFTLMDKALKTAIVSVKDRTNTGQLSSELMKYVNSDGELAKVLNGTHYKYEGVLEESNWWECSVKQGEEFLDVSWTLDTDKLSEAISEVKSVMFDYIKDLLLEDLPF